MSLHFFYKFRPISLPAQCFQSEFDVTVCSPDAQHRFDNQFYAHFSFMVLLCRVWVEYERLGVCMRVGSSTLENTMLFASQMPVPTEQVNVMTVDPSSDHSLAYVVLNTGVRQCQSIFTIWFQNEL